MTPPRLETARLVLAGPVPADLDELAAMWADPAVHAALRAEPFSREEVWQRLLRYVGHWQAIGYGTWMVRHAATGRFVGEVGLMDSRRATEPSFEGTPEAGWALAGWAHEQGFAREALAALFGWADARGLGAIACIIAPENRRSARLAERFGFARLAEARYRGGSIDLYRRAPPAVDGADRTA